jgi:putative transposase
MNDPQSLAHTKWACKYHVVWIPKYRKKKLFEGLRKELGPVLCELARHKESEILEGRFLLDHVHNADRNSSEMCRSPGGLVYQGQERDPGDGKGTLPASTSGREAILSRPLGSMKT